MMEDWVDKFNEEQERGTLPTEGVSWNEIVELAPIEAREYEILIYLNYDLIEEVRDIAKALTEFEKGGYVCGRGISGRNEWRGHQVVHYYDFILCRNSASQPRTTYRPYEECKEKVKENYAVFSLFHTHPPSSTLYTVPSITDLKHTTSMFALSSVASVGYIGIEFLIGPYYFIAYDLVYPFTVIFDTSRSIRSKRVTKYKYPKTWTEYTKRIKKEFPSQYEKFQFATAPLTTLGD